MRIHNLRWLVSASILFMFHLSATGNHVLVTNVALVDVGNGTADVAFDLSWENSWRFTVAENGTNVIHRDAAWVFVKFRAGGEWRHAWLTASNHAPAIGTAIDIASNGGDTNIGAYVYRATDGAGTLEATQMKLRWDYTKNGLTGTNNVDISVQAIEMVYVPEGPFWVGSGGTEPGPFYTYPDNTDPFAITHSEEIVVGTETGNLWYASYGDHSGPIPAEFPNGYDAFYCMKYEVSQGQYTEFLNMLPSGQDWNRYPNQYGNIRHTIYETNGAFACDAPDRACNYLSWGDLGAILDWSGLRPMTELEFEKVCRGPLAPVPNEYAWGDTVIISVTAFSGVDGSGEETSDTAGANCAYSGGIPGPIRVGLFATATSGRHGAGAGYTGAMELSGNLSEQIVNIGSPQSRSFLGTPGDGDTAAVPADWPDPLSAVGSGLRGSDWSSSAGRQATSHRQYSDSAQSSRSHTIGGRGVRSVP